MIATASRKKLTAIVVSHSHWDREWYLPYQSFRFRLVGMLDRLLDLMARKPDYKHFMLDGQAILVEDYLEIRPDRREEVQRRVREGRLLVGPWYIPPDEYLPGGEALIRNLLRGIRLSRSLGGVMMVGYEPDTFGHIAYLPTILKGFGINSAVLWRGIDESIKTTEFAWRAPDGSEVLTIHMPLSYYFRGGLPDSPDQAAQMLEEIRSRLAPMASTTCILVMDGMDHAMPKENLPEGLRAARTRFDDMEVIHGTLPLLIDCIRSEAMNMSNPWPVWEGEIRSCQRTPVLPGTISARMWVKQRNQSNEDLLLRYAEPLSVWVSLLKERLGSAWHEAALPPFPLSRMAEELESIKGLLGRAWRALLENQAHDGICGCSVDEVHREMMTRFDACQQIGEGLVDIGFSGLTTQLDTGGERAIVAFNALSGSRTDLVSSEWLPPDDSTVVTEVIDPSGKRIPCQVLTRPKPNYMKMPGVPSRWMEIGFVAPSVPGCGYKAFRVVTGPDTGPAEPKAVNEIENEFFKVCVDANDGTVTVVDKRFGGALSGLNRFVDGADRGDEYAYWAPGRETLVDAPAVPPEVALVEDGPARRTLEVRMNYRLPRSLSEDRTGRSRQKLGCPITSRVSLYPGVPRVDFETEVENNAEDHRLRVHFPTGIDSDVSHAEQHFGVLSRPVAVPVADETWAEQPDGAWPQKSFVDINDGSKGVMLANRGLPEYEALPSANGLTIALTLLRCVGWLYRGDVETRRGAAGPSFSETPDAQCLGHHTFEYSLIPHNGGWQQAFAEAHAFAVPLRGRAATGKGKEPAQAALLEITSPKLVLSGLKFAEDGDGIIVRLYNIEDRPVRARLRLNEPHDAAEFVNLNEERIAKAEEKDGWVSLALRRNEIVSLRFRAKMAEHRRPEISNW